MATRPLWRDLLRAAALGLGGPAMGGLALGAIALVRACGIYVPPVMDAIAGLPVIMLPVFLIPVAIGRLIEAREWYPKAWLEAQRSAQRAREPLVRARQLLAGAGATDLVDDIFAVNAIVGGLVVRVDANSLARLAVEVTGSFAPSISLGPQPQEDPVRTGDADLDREIHVGGGDAALAALGLDARALVVRMARRRLRVEFGQVRADASDGGQLLEMVALAKAFVARPATLETLALAVGTDPARGVRRACLMRLIAAHRTEPATLAACQTAFAGDDPVSRAVAAAVLGRDPPPVEAAEIEAASNALGGDERAALLELLAKAGAEPGQLELVEMSADAGSLSIATEDAAGALTLAVARPAIAKK